MVAPVGGSARVAHAVEDDTVERVALQEFGDQSLEVFLNGIETEFEVLVPCGVFGPKVGIAAQPLGVLLEDMAGLKRDGAIDIGNAIEFEPGVDPPGWVPLFIPLSTTSRGSKFSETPSALGTISDV
jgi:hypothetical protein